MSRFFFIISALIGCLTNQLSASYELQLAVAAIFRNEANYLKEWIDYHHMAGVEYFWLYDNESTDNWREVLQPYIDQGLVEVVYWPTLENSSFIVSQVEAYKDVINRTIGHVKWIALIDIDEFLLPMKDRSIPECLENHFSDASAIYVNWRNFGTGGVKLSPGEPILPRLTTCSLSTHSNNGIGKSIIRPEFVDLECVWYPHHFTLKSDAYYVNGNQQKLTFVGGDLQLDGRHYDQYLRINHYVMRDENFFRNVRLEKANRGYGDKNLLLEHYDSFSKDQDYTIINFVRKINPEMDQEIWGD